MRIPPDVYQDISTLFWGCLIWAAILLTVRIGGAWKLMRHHSDAWFYLRFEEEKLLGMRDTALDDWRHQRKPVTAMRQVEAIDAALKMQASIKRLSP